MVLSKGGKLAPHIIILVMANLVTGRKEDLQAMGLFLLLIFTQVCDRVCVCVCVCARAHVRACVCVCACFYLCLCAYTC